MFSGIGGFEYGIEQAFRHPDVQNIRAGQDGEKDCPAKDRQGLHSIPKQGAISTADRSDEHSHSSSDQRQPHCVGFSEINGRAISVYNKRFKEHKNYGDAKTIDPTTLPDFEMLVGGFPCQAFSLAGKRGGLNDTRGTLFFDIARVAEHKRPRYLVLENVKGLLSHDNGKTLQTILEVFTKIGYQLQWCLLNSRDFGVPQNRERIYIVGYLGEGSAPQVFPLRDCYQTTDQVRNQDNKLSGDSRDSEGKDRRSPERREIYIREATKKGYAVAGEGDSVNFSQPNSKTRRGRVGKGYANTLDTGVQQGVVQRKVSKTIRVGGGGSPHGSKQNWDSYEVEGTIRRLTPLECERLQGFPDNWTEFADDGQKVSDTQRYKMCGNAVTTNVVQAVVTEILLQDESL